MQTSRFLYAVVLPVAAALSTALTTQSSSHTTRPRDGWNGALSAAAQKTPLSKAQVWERIRTYAPSLGERTPNSTVTCYVTDPSGLQVSKISPSFTGAQSYWLNYSAGGSTATDINFSVVPLYDGSPLASIRQRFTPALATNITTPFGIPFWGLAATSGPWILIVETELREVALYPFTVE